MRKQEIGLTVDSVIFTGSGQELKVLLIKRKNPPFQGGWALPGGFLEKEETLIEGALRELKEETGLIGNNLMEIGTFSEIGRDPRGRTISFAFWTKSETEVEVVGQDDAEEARWWKLDNLPNEIEIAFDHFEIIRSALILYYDRFNEI